MTERAGEQLTGTAALERVAGIARALSEAEDLDTTLQLVVDLAVGYIEPCDGATMLFIRPDGEVVTPAWSGQQARAADLAQHKTGEGPCFSALREHRTIVIDDLASEDRWPKWRAEVSELGWRSMVGLRLFVAGDTMGALNLYSSRSGGFDTHAQALAHVFASHAAVAMKAVLGTAAGEEGVEVALLAREVIGQAKGILMVSHELTPDEAYTMLRRVSDEHNIEVHVLATQIIAGTMTLP